MGCIPIIEEIAGHPTVLLVGCRDSLCLTPFTSISIVNAVDLLNGVSSFIECVLSHLGRNPLPVKVLIINHGSIGCTTVAIDVLILECALVGVVDGPDSDAVSLVVPLVAILAIVGPLARLCIRNIVDAAQRATSLVIGKRLFAQRSTIGIILALAHHGAVHALLDFAGTVGSGLCQQLLCTQETTVMFLLGELLHFLLPLSLLLITSELHTASLGSHDFSTMNTLVEGRRLASDHHLGGLCHHQQWHADAE